MAGASAMGTVLFAGCAIPTKELLVQSPHDMPEDFGSGFDNWYASLYPTGAGVEGVIVRVMEGRAKKVEGNPDYPVNQGKTSVRAQAAVQELYHPDRLKMPMRKQGDGSFSQITWDQARAELVAQLKSKQAAPGDVLLITQPVRGTLGKMVGLFAKEYGAKHMAYEPLDSTALRSAVKSVFGTDQLPTFDIAHADLLLSFGADFLGTWVSPVQFNHGYGEFRQGEGRPRGYFIHIEPRLSQTAANADEWVYVTPGTEGILAAAIAQAVQATGKAKNAAALGTLPRVTVEEAAQKTGVSAEKIRHIAELFGNAAHPLVIGGGSAGAHTNGTTNLQTIYSLNVLAGNVGKEGGVILNPAFPLADIPSTAAGVPYKEWKALAGRIGDNNVVIVRGANPVYGLPQGLNFGAALDKAGFVVAFASFMDETAAVADLALPESLGLESWGDDVPEPGPGYATLGIMQPVVRPVLSPQGEGDLRGESRQFGDELLALSRELGLKTLPWANTREAVQATAKQLYDGGKMGLVKATDWDGYWRGLLMRGGWWDPAAKAAAPAAPAALPATIAEPQSTSGNLPYYLIPFPSVSLLHGEGAHLPWLQGTPDPMTTMAWKNWLEINVKTAETLGVRLGDEVELTTGQGQSIAVPVYPTPAAAPDVLAAVMGQGHTHYGQWAQGRGQNVLAVLADVTDATSGGLAWAATKVSVRKTGRRVLMTKFEGVAPTVMAEDVSIVEVTRGAGADAGGTH